MMILLALFFSMVSQAQQPTPQMTENQAAALAAALAAAQKQQAASPTKTGGEPQLGGLAEKLRMSPFCDSHSLNQVLASKDYSGARVTGTQVQLNSFGRNFADDQPQAYRITFAGADGKELPPVEVVCSRKVH